MAESRIRVDDVRIPRHRENNGSCLALANSIRDEGQRRPITVWKDGTLISGERRVFAHLLLEMPRISAVFVSTIEDAAKQLMIDYQDDYLAIPAKWSEVCRLWQTLRRLDEPAAVERIATARRRGVELRRATQAGQRTPGRTHTRTDDYVLSVICEPYGVSCATATRVERIWRAANGLTEETDERRTLAREIMAGLDSGDAVWPCFERWRGERAALVSRPRPNMQAVPPAEPLPAAKQIATWNRTLPQLEGLLVGLIEQGAPNSDLTWEQVGPVHTRLKLVRRELEKIINGLKEIDK